jgi:hypothetical protein
VDRSLSLPRVLSLVGGLGLVAAFFMPWFSTQGLLLSGQFLHNFLVAAGPADLQRFLPGSTPTEAQLLRWLVDFFPVAGALAAAAALFGGLAMALWMPSNIVLGVVGALSLVAWAIGLSQLPAGARPEIGLWLIGAGAAFAILGLVLELVARRTASRHAG